MDEPRDEPTYEFVTMYRFGHSDGYTHTHNSVLYTTFAKAQAAGQMQHGNYAVDPLPFSCIRLSNGRTYIIDGPIYTAAEAELEKVVRQRALAKLNKEEIRLLGIEP